MSQTSTDTGPPVPPAADPHRLFAGWVRTARAADFAAHQRQYGPLPVAAYPGRSGRARLIEAVEAAGLRGRGGAGFPTGRKLRAVAAAARRGAVVIANGCDGEPAGDKDHALLDVAPHLVVDGAILAAYAVGATEIILCVHRDDDLAGRLARALAQRPGGEPAVRVTPVPARYVSSEASALVNFLETGDGRPTTKPPHVSERGVRGRPTLVDNVETLAHLALIARYGAEWFRGCGTADSPGTALFTVSGAVSRPGVYEAALGTPLAQTLRLAGEPVAPVNAVLVGGYGGSWLPMPAAAELPLDHASLRTAGASLGAGSLWALPSASCGLAETARLLRYLAGESAAQCGPCMFGLPAIAADFAQLALGTRDAPAAVQRVRRRLPVITGRGACGHPDGAVRLAASALETFEPDLRAHLAGRPCRWTRHARLPLPPRQHRSGDWS
ncbi:proton-conducting membrane transporter [Amycolatopsis sp. K13G38]|uniref:Proton-conducting membrane transporter n=1 Tax=Amycolatopsis acididurans TaxID=2724524 RepID=A0ABX1JC35_9PSEU|nr:NADH-ubiquinone oxidoreductase-F iron-sulfur binding region domain-containing protein [Amycolatopsis acididurans]NKQ55981.1 proton-conducting membrane transporter [Amycolatopsis acididurans]